MVLLNLGGEGEVADAINLNSLAATRRSVEYVMRQRPLIVGDFLQMPVADGVVDEVVGNAIPLVGFMPYVLASESHRVLKAGGLFRGYASSGGGGILVAPLITAGFRDVTLVDTYARGVK